MMPSDPSTPPRALEIRPATRADVETLAAFARDTYRVAFGHSFQPSDLETHLEKHLSDSAVAQMLNTDFILLAQVGEDLVGFVQFGAVTPEMAQSDTDAGEIRRLYVHPGFQNRRVGARLLQTALDHPGLRDAPVVFLDVWEDNPGAIRFYQRHDFVAVSARPFTVASGAETGRDLIMEWRRPSIG